MDVKRCLSRSRAALCAAALLSLASWASGAAAQAVVDTCPGANFRKLPFMTTPDANFNPLSWWGPNLVDYLKEYSQNSLLQPGAPIAAVWVLLLVTLMVFLLWRCIRCCCVVCCQQEAFGEAHGILTGAAIRRWKALLLCCGVIACGMCVWGMVSMPKELLQGFWPAYDNITIFGNSMADNIDALAVIAQNMSRPLAALSSVIYVDINPGVIKSNLKKVGAFLDNAPTPDTFLGQISNVTAGVQDLDSSLTDLAKLLAAGPPPTPLGQLNSSLRVATGFDPLYASINTSISNYQQRLAGLSPPQPQPSSNADPRLQSLRTAQNAMTISSWISQLNNIQSALGALGGMATNSPTSNPLLQLQAAVIAVETSADALRDGGLADLADSVDTFNLEWMVNGSTGLIDLLKQVAYINSTVVGLPEELVQNTKLMNATLANIAQLYNTSSSTNLGSLPDTINNASSQLVLPPDLAAAKSLLQSGGTQLANSRQAITDLSGWVTQLTSLLVNMSTPVSAVDQELTNYMTGQTASYTPLRNAIAAAKVVVDIAAPQLSAGASSSTFSSTASSITTTLSNLDLAAYRSSLSGVVQQLAALPDMSSFTTPLQGINSTYSGLGTPPSNSTVMVAKQIDILVNQTISTALEIQTHVKEVTDQVAAISGTVRQQVISRLLLVKSKIKGYEAQYQPYVYMGFLLIYAIIIALILLLLLVSWRNCPCGLCTFGGFLNLLLVLFFLLPMMYTVLLLGLRDGCHNAESLIYTGVGQLTCSSNCSSGSGPTKAQVLTQYYLQGTGGSLQDVLKVGLNVDLAQLKGDAKTSVDEAIQQITTKMQPRQKVQAIIDDAVSIVNDILSSLDNFVAGLGYQQVQPLYRGVKSWLCCTTADTIFMQWAASLGCAVAALVALWGAMGVLRKLDGLAEGCCATTCYNPADYSAAPAPQINIELPSTEDGGSTPMAYISIGANTFGQKGGKGAKYIKQGEEGKEEDAYSGLRVPSSTPGGEWPAPVMLSAPSAPVMGSPRMYPVLQQPSGPPAMVYPGYLPGPPPPGYGPLPAAGSGPGTPVAAQGYPGAATAPPLPAGYDGLRVRTAHPSQGGVPPGMAPPRR